MTQNNRIIASLTMQRLYSIAFTCFIVLSTYSNQKSPSYTGSTTLLEKGYSDCISRKSQLSPEEKKRIVAAIKQQENGQHVSSKEYKDIIKNAHLEDYIIIFKSTHTFGAQKPNIYLDAESGKKIAYFTVYEHQDLPKHYTKAINAHEIGHIFCYCNPSLLKGSQINSLTVIRTLELTSTIYSVIGIVATAFIPTFAILQAVGGWVVLAGIHSNAFSKKLQKQFQKEEFFCDSFAVLATQDYQTLSNYLDNPSEHIKDYSLAIQEQDDIVKKNSDTLKLPFSSEYLHPAHAERIKNILALQEEVKKNGPIADPSAFAYEWVNKRYPIP